MAPAGHEETFGRVITAMITPFREDGSLDVDGAVRLAGHLLSHGSDGLVLSGSTGEGSVLSDDERIALWRAVSESTEAPIIVGSTSNDTAHSVELTRRASELGIAGILAVTPYYNRPHQGGLEAHFRAVASSTHLPVILYDIPIRTGRKIARETILRLAQEVDNIIGLKDASGDPSATAQLLSEVPEGFCCWSGDDSLTMSLLSVGAVGVISVASHWCGEEFTEMIRAFVRGDVVRAIELNRALLESYRFESGDDAPNPIPTKAMMRVLGLPAGQCRLPLGDAPSGVEDHAKDVMSHLETFRGASR